VRIFKTLRGIICQRRNKNKNKTDIVARNYEYNISSCKSLHSTRSTTNICPPPFAFRSAVTYPRFPVARIVFPGAPQSIPRIPRSISRSSPLGTCEPRYARARAIKCPKNKRERERGKGDREGGWIALTMLRAPRVSLDAAKLQIKGLLNNYAVGGRSSPE